MRYDIRFVPAFLFVIIFNALAGCQRPAAQQSTPSMSLTDARKSFKTKLLVSETSNEPLETPPVSMFRMTKYSSPVGSLYAYITPDPQDGKRHPAIIWITGGDCNSIGDVWHEGPADNEQTASAYRKAGIVLMFPSLRGGSQNPGHKEGFLGEVDDVIGAAIFLRSQKYVDPSRIYLGGHSTGGTLAMLVAESTDRFRAVFSFGPVGDVATYGADSGFVPVNLNNTDEVRLRSPGYWMASIKKPTWVMEGAKQGNIQSLRLMRDACKNPQAHFLEIRGATHFSTLAPTNALIARKILDDTGSDCNISFTEDELDQNYRDYAR